MRHPPEVVVFLTVAFTACQPAENGAARALDSTAVTTIEPKEDIVPAARSNPPSTDEATDSALAVLRAYYGAIDHRDFARAYAAWGDNGPPGHPTLSAFAAGFDSTQSVTVTIGNPSRIEGAAGSRYLTVPVTVHAIEGAAKTTYEGEYTLRRSVVDGATPAQTRWHLYGASIHRSGAF